MLVNKGRKGLNRGLLAYVHAERLMLAEVTRGAGGNVLAFPRLKKRFQQWLGSKMVLQRGGMAWINP